MNVKALRPVAKALVAGAAAGVGALAVAAADDRITTGEWWAGAAATLAALAAVWRVPNRPPGNHE